MEQPDDAADLEKTADQLATDPFRPADQVKNHLAPLVPPRKGVNETVRPFNGRNLDGWDYTDKFWSVQGDTIVAKSVEPVITSTYCLTQETFSDFRMLVKVKLVESLQRFNNSYQVCHLEYFKLIDCTS